MESATAPQHLHVDTTETVTRGAPHPPTECQQLKGRADTATCAGSCGPAEKGERTQSVTVAGMGFAVVRVQVKPPPQNLSRKVRGVSWGRSCTCQPPWVELFCGDPCPSGVFCAVPMCIPTTYSYKASFMASSAPDEKAHALFGDLGVKSLLLPV